MTSTFLVRQCTCLYCSSLIGCLLSKSASLSFIGMSSYIDWTLPTATRREFFVAVINVFVVCSRHHVVDYVVLHSPLHLRFSKTVAVVMIRCDLQELIISLFDARSRLTKPLLRRSQIILCLTLTLTEPSHRHTHQLYFDTPKSTKTMPPQNRNETGDLEVERPIHRIVSRGELSVASEGNDSANGGPSTPRSAKEYRVRKSSLIGYVSA
jgi:hypothetical protein